MEHLFSGTVEVLYYDTFSLETRAVQKERIQRFEEQRWPYPISLVDGEVVSVGSLSTFSLIHAVKIARQRSKNEG